MVSSSRFTTSPLRGFLVALYDLAAEGDGALLIDIFQQIVVVNYDLKYAVLVADIEEHNAAVIADILDPARHANLLTDVFFSEFTAAYGAFGFIIQNLPFRY